MIRRVAEILTYAELCKLRIALMSALSAGMGFLLSAHKIGWGIFSATLGVFLLACGACALNQFQERDIDANMPRTAGRPLPSGRITPAGALCFALTGAVPPAIGWVLGGGALTDYRLATVCFFFFMWQAPHFWLFLMDHGDEYEKAGLPSPAALFSRPQLRRVTFAWISGAAVSALFIPMRGIVQNYFISLSLFAASVWLIFGGIRVLRAGNGDDSFKLTFRGINVFALIIMLLLSLDKLLRVIIL